MNKQQFILTILFFCVSILSIQAQDEGKKGGLFVRANVGYAFEAVHTVQGVDQDREQMSNIYGSTAPGLNFGAGLGYMFNDYVGLELGVNYTMGAKKFSEVQAENLPLGLEGGGSEFTLLDAYIFERYTHQSTQLRLIPAVVIRGGNGKVVPYAKVGMVVPVMGKTKTTVDGSLTTTSIPTSIAGFPIPGFTTEGVSLVGTVDAEAESFGQFSVGFDATVGVDYQISDKISIFGELNMTALTIKSKETKVLRYDGVYDLEGSPMSLSELENTINTGIQAINLIPGVDIGTLDFGNLGLYENISEVPVAEQHFIYVDQLNSMSNNPMFNSQFNENLPEDQLARRDNNSSIGINVGVKFNF